MTVRQIVDAVMTAAAAAVDDGRSPSTLRKSWPIKDPAQRDKGIPDGTKQRDFTFSLPFMNREEQCKDCFDHFQAMFNKFSINPSPTTSDVNGDQARKLYPLVICAGGPGIGQ
jgi:hypothetical protein